MALTADGWHMATHVAAFGMAALGYAISRRFATHKAFTFGTGKVHALAGYTSAIVLAIVSILMMAESISRLAAPELIDYASSLPVAVIGLAVNLLSIWLLHDHESTDDDDEDDDDHHHHHDHNHRAAVLHVIADALTGSLAIAALLTGQWLGWRWLDPVTGVIGGIVILSWAFGLCRHAAHELLDFRRGDASEATIRTTLEELGDVHVHDLHVWSLGRGRLGCIVALASPTPRRPAVYRALILEKCPISHLTIEVEGFN
jgi:cation diffusion facilitator family transporter